MKNQEDIWKDKYTKINTDYGILKEELDKRNDEIHELKNTLNIIKSYLLTNRSNILTILDKINDNT